MNKLNDLIYEASAGFAQYVLEVRNPKLKRFLNDFEISELEQSLDCVIKQIMVRI